MIIRVAEDGADDPSIKFNPSIGVFRRADGTIENPPVHHCDNCGEHTHWYMLKNDIWLKVVLRTGRFLCLRCVERRLLRRLRRRDFTMLPNDLF